MLILLVDPNKVFVASLRAILLKAGFSSILYVDHGFACIHSACTLKHPEVIIIDETQCFLAGLDIIEEIHTSWPEAKVIVLTGIGSDLNIDMFPDTGSMYFMDKKSINAENLPQLLYNIVTQKVSFTRVPQANKVFKALRRSFTGMLNSILI